MRASRIRDYKGKTDLKPVKEQVSLIKESGYTNVMFCTTRKTKNGWHFFWEFDGPDGGDEAAAAGMLDLLIAQLQDEMGYHPEDDLEPEEDLDEYESEGEE